MKPIYARRGITMLLALLAHTGLRAQTVQVVTRTIEKNISYNGKDLVKINAEKSHIEVHGWDKPTVYLKIKLISKHADKKQAEQELEYLHFGVSTSNNTIELTNTFVFPKKVSGVKGMLKTEYEIWLPKNCPLEILDKFGDINLNSLNAHTIIKVEYCGMQLSNCAGKIFIEGTFSDLNGDNLNADLNYRASHADIKLNVYGGRYSIATSYGSIQINATRKLNGLNINASRCPVVFTTNGFDLYSYRLSTTYAIIRLPDKKYNSFRRSVHNTEEFIMQGAKGRPLLDINTSYEPVTIN